MFLAVSDVYTKIWKSSRLRKDALIVARLLLLLPNFLCQPWSCAFFSFSLLLLFSIWSYIGNTLATDCHTTTMVFLIFVVLASFYFDLSSRLNVLYSFYYTHMPIWCPCQMCSVRQFNSNNPFSSSTNSGIIVLIVAIVIRMPTSPTYCSYKTKHWGEEYSSFTCEEFRVWRM